MILSDERKEEFFLRLFFFCRFFRNFNYFYEFFRKVFEFVVFWFDFVFRVGREIYKEFSVLFFN